MGDSIKNALIFLTGLGIGAAATYKLLDAKYKKIANEEIESMREYYISKSDKKENEVTVAETIVEKYEKPDLTEYAAKIDQSGYTNYSGISSPEEEKKEDYKEDVNEKPYVIEPDEFGMFDDYETVNLTYYSDGYLVEDMTDELLSNDEVESSVGWETLNDMGKYEPDILHVRNDVRKMDYEICSVLEKYKED